MDMDGVAGCIDKDDICLWNIYEVELFIVFFEKFYDIIYYK